MKFSKSKFRNITVEYLDNEEMIDTLNESISFITPEILLKIKLPEKYIIHFDEFHETFFKENVFDIL